MALPCAAKPTHLSTLHVWPLVYASSPLSIDLCGLIDFI